MCVLLFGFIVFDMIHKRVSLFCCLVHFGGFFSLDFGRFSAWLQEGCSFMHVLLFSKRIKPKKRHATTISHRDICTHHADRLTFVALLSLFTSRLVRSRVRFFFIYLYYKIKLTTKISKSLSPFGTILNCVQLQSHIQPNNDTNTTDRLCQQSNNNTRNQPEEHNNYNINNKCIKCLSCDEFFFCHNKILHVFYYLYPPHPPTPRSVCALQNIGLVSTLCECVWAMAELLSLQHLCCCLGNPVEISFGLYILILNFCFFVFYFYFCLMSLSSEKPFKQLQIKANSIR